MSVKSSSKVSRKSKRKLPFFDTIGRGCVGFFLFRFGANVFAALRRTVRRTLYDQYCPYFSPEAMVKLPRSAKRRLETLIEVSFHFWIYL